MHVVHWSGSCKPAVLRLEDADVGERDALQLYQQAYATHSMRLQPVISRLAGQVRLKHAALNGHWMAGSAGTSGNKPALVCSNFVAGSPVVYNFGSRCGNCCGAPRDTTSKMCMGATEDGLLKHIGEAEVRARCSKDERCKGYYAKKGLGFRPFSDRVWVTGSGPRFCDGWAVYEKACASKQNKSGDETRD